MQEVFAWRELAACRLADPSLFFGRDGEAPGEHALRERAAVALCNDCPVRRPCADFAVANEVADGVWGGMTESFRQRAARHTR